MSNALPLFDQRVGIGGLLNVHIEANTAIEARVAPSDSLNTSANSASLPSCALKCAMMIADMLSPLFVPSPLSQAPQVSSEAQKLNATRQSSLMQKPNDHHRFVHE